MAFQEAAKVVRPRLHAACLPNLKELASRTRPSNHLSTSYWTPPLPKAPHWGQWGKGERREGPVETKPGVEGRHIQRQSCHPSPSIGCIDAFERIAGAGQN